MTNRILKEHFCKIRNNLVEFSKIFDIAKHGDIKGYGREALVNEFLKSHLPDQIEYLTGEIIDENDQRSGQVDIILQAKHCAKIPLFGNAQIVFSDAVISAIEVKSTLNKSHLYSTLDNFKKIKSLKRQDLIKGHTNHEGIHKTPCILFTFGGMKVSSLLKNIDAYASKNNLHLDEFAPDFVLDLSNGYYICKNDDWLFKKSKTNNSYYIIWNGDADEVLAGLYMYLVNFCTSYLVRPPLFDLNVYFKH